MPKYTNKSTGQTFTSPRELSADELEELFAAAGGGQQSLPEPIPAHAIKTPEPRFMQTLRAPAQEFVKSYQSHPSNVPANVVAGGGMLLNQAFSFPMAALDVVGQYAPNPSVRVGALLAKDIAGKAYENLWYNPARSGLEAITSGLDKVFGRPTRGQLETRKEILDVAPNVLALRTPELTRGAAEVGSAIRNRPSLAINEISQAAPPKPSEVSYKPNLERAKGYIAEQARETPIRSRKTAMRESVTLTRNAMQKLWRGKVLPQVAANSDILIDGSAVAAKIKESVTKIMKSEFRDKAEAILKDAGELEGQRIPIAEAWNRVDLLNKELDPIYSMSPADQFAATQANPIIGAKKLRADLFREAIFDALGQRGGTGIADLRKDYGALAGMRDAFYRNVVRSEKKPTPLLRGGWRSSPLFWGMAAGGATGFLGMPPSVAIPAGLALGVASEISRVRGRPAVQIKRGINRLGRSGIEPPQYPMATPPAPPIGGAPSPFTPQPPIGGQPPPPTFPSSPWNPPVQPYAVPQYPVPPAPPWMQQALQFQGQDLFNRPTPPLLMRPTSGPELGPSATGGGLTPIPQPPSGSPRWGTQSELGRRLPPPPSGGGSAPQLGMTPQQWVNDIGWVRGEDASGLGVLRGKSGDKFFSTSEDIAGDYGNVRRIQASELPKNPLVVDDKYTLAEKIGYRGDPYAEKVGIKDNFDDMAKAFAKKQGHDAIIYRSGSFEEPELHVFGSAPPNVPPPRPTPPTGVTPASKFVADRVEGIIERGTPKEYMGIGSERVKALHDEIKKQVPDYRDFNYQYLSLNRPLDFIGFKESGIPDGSRVVMFDNGTKSTLLTKEPLPPEAIVQYELTPRGGKGIADLVWQYSQKQGHSVVELSREADGGGVVAAIYKNPRKKWQVSYFDERGPMSHGEYNTPQEAIQEAMSAGYKKYDPGTLDAIAPNFNADLLKKMSEGFGKEKSLSPTGVTPTGGEPVKFDKTAAGLQGNMFQVQAQQPKGMITSNIPLQDQIAGTMFEPPKPVEPSLFQPTPNISPSELNLQRKIAQEAQMSAEAKAAKGLKGIAPNPILKEALNAADIQKIQDVLRLGGMENIKIVGPDGKPLSSTSIRAAIEEWNKDKGTEASYRAQALIESILKAYESGMIEVRPMKGMPHVPVPLQDYLGNVPF